MFLDDSNPCSVGDRFREFVDHNHPILDQVKRLVII